MEKNYYLTYVVGDRGAGKTTLLAHFATEFMIPPNSINDLLKCKEEIESLRLGGWENLSLEKHVKHLVYVVEETFIAKGLGYKPRISMELPFEKIGIYDGKNEVYHLLPFAKIFMPEIQSKLDSRKSITSERVTDSFLRYIERERKVGVQMWADTQINDSADKRFRSLADKVIEVLGQEHKKNKQGEIISTKWKCLEFTSVLVHNRYKETGKTEQAIKTEYTHIGNIYDCVDSFSGKEYFFSGLENKNFDTKLSKIVGHSKEEMLEKVKNFPLFKNEDSGEIEI